MDERHVIDGLLGCPICRRQYPVRDGIAWFTTAEPNADRLTHVAATHDEERIMRAGALLGLTDGGGIVCLDEAWADCADALTALGPAHVVVLNANAGAAGETVSVLAVDDKLPFAPGALRAVALGAASGSLVASASAATRSRGRLVVPADIPVPDGVLELARDGAVWVGERGAVASAPIALRSARR
jgi:hypothetical protein